MKVIAFWLKFHRRSFSPGSTSLVGGVRQQAIAWTNYPNYQSIGSDNDLASGHYLNNWRPSPQALMS